MTLESRIARLEAESDIRKLKARYLNACDSKDVDRIRACFTKDAVIDFPPLGEFDVDGLIGIFTQMAASTSIIDSHHGHNAEINVAGEKAEAVWNLGFSTFNPEDNSFRLLAGFYHDRYEKHGDEWLISYTRSSPRKIVDGQLAETGPTAHLVKDQ